MPRLTYEHGRFDRAGEPVFLVAADYQYYRDRRENWAARLDQLQAGHVNTITFYTPWRHHLFHDPRSGTVGYDFTGETLDSRDLVHFLDLCAERDLYMIAKPGPFVHSELNIGGLPDVASPSFNPEIEPVRTQDGAPLRWEYDNTQLPAPDDPRFADLARDFLLRVREVLAPHAGEDGWLIALQLNDETLYCTSNDPPWRFGYDAPSMRRYHEMLAARYATLEEYNRLHGTAHRAFAFVTGPRTAPGTPVATRREELLAYLDWSEHQWRIRTDLYAEYKAHLDLDLPYLSNFAGITPPIDENVPGQEAAAEPDVPAAYAPLYPEWWFAQNRVDLDREVYHYGMISWLGVAAYNVADASTAPADDVGDNEVFHRYVTTARRGRGINMEENWGFSKLYHPLSRFPLIPVFQTLVSVAGGCTGYVVFTGVCHDYWTEDLDRTTKRQHPTFPADAPIGPRGETGEMYAAMSLLNEWFAREGAGFLRAEPEPELCLLLVPEYAAISSWVPSDAEWGLEHRIPRLGHGAIEPATMTLNRNGINYELVELAALDDAALQSRPLVAMPSAFFLGRAEQEKLARYVEAGGTLILSGELPAYDAWMQPCTVLADLAAQEPPGLLYSPHNLFSDEGSLLAALKQAGWTPRLSLPPDVAAFLYTHEDHRYLFFFHFGNATATREIHFYGPALTLTLGPKTCGVLHLADRQIVSYLVKANNEYAGVEATWEVRYGDTVIQGQGDGSGYDLV